MKIMNSSNARWNARSPRGSRSRAILILLLTAAIAAGCGDLLEVEAPTRVPAERVEDLSNAELLVRSAIADFDCAFADYITATSLIGDAFVDSQLSRALWDYDRRTVTETSLTQHTASCGGYLPGIYTSLSTARFSTANAILLIEDIPDESVPNKTELLATVQAYAGYSRLLLGEAYCAAGSLVLEDGQLVPGPLVTSQELFQLAEERFTRAIEGARAAGASEILSFAYLGRARARLNQGDLEGARADALQVPPGFVRYAHYTAQGLRPSNHIWIMNNRDQQISVSPDFRDVRFKGVPDTRIPVVDEGTLAADNFTPWFTQQKYPSQSSRIPIARYAEAQLIIAEAELGQTAVDIINRLHAEADLPPYTPDDVSNDIEILGHVIEDRRREFFLESQRFYDTIRYRRIARELGIAPAELNPHLPPTPAAGTPFPQKGGSYGTLECLPLPQIERVTNPHID